MGTTLFLILIILHVQDQCISQPQFSSRLGYKQSDAFLPYSIKDCFFNYFILLYKYIILYKGCNTEERVIDKKGIHHEEICFV